MKKHFLLAACIMGVAFAMTFGFPSLAADDHSGTTPAAKDAKATVTGRVTVQKQISEGAEVTVAHIKVLSISNIGGNKVPAGTQRETVRVVGLNPWDLEQYDGRVITITGTWTAPNEFHAEGILKK